MKNSTVTFNEKLFQHRRTGTRGTPIVMHRALRRLTLKPSSLIAIITLPVLFDLLLWNNLESIIRLWTAIFNFWIDRLHLDGYVSFADTKFLGTHVYIPYLDLLTTLPSQAAVMINIFISVVLFEVANLMPKNYLPATYVLRAALLIQISASFYFILSPESPPFELISYIPGMLALGLYLILLVSPLLAMIYYIFDFPFWHKLTVTAVIIGYFVIALPFQYMFHALIISSGSMLFMPVLYLLFGSLLNTFTFVSWYAWAMTWGSKANLT